MRHLSLSEHRLLSLAKHELNVSQNSLAAHVSRSSKLSIISLPNSCIRSSCSSFDNKPSSRRPDGKWSCVVVVVLWARREDVVCSHRRRASIAAKTGALDTALRRSTNAEAVRIAPGANELVVPSTNARLSYALRPKRSRFSGGASVQNDLSSRLRRMVAFGSVAALSTCGRIRPFGSVAALSTCARRFLLAACLRCAGSAALYSLTHLPVPAIGSKSTWSSTSPPGGGSRSSSSCTNGTGI